MHKGWNIYMSWEGELVEAEASGELKRRLEEANDVYGFSGVEDRHVGKSRLMLRNVFGAG